MKVIKYDLASDTYQNILKRSSTNIQSLREQVKPIINAVAQQGNRAICDYISRYDNLNIKPDQFLITNEEMAAAFERLTSNLQEALQLRHNHIHTLHATQNSVPPHVVRDGIFAGEKITPLPSAGLYVPGGTASFPTVAQILAVPAQIAQVPRVVMCTPPGGVTDTVLGAAFLSGVHEFYRIGGVAAIAALAYGTETIKPVSTIVGPGNVYVTAAKMEVFGQVSVDMPAGPSEAIIIAGPEANPSWVAIDVLARAEHDAFAAGVVVTWSKKLAMEVSDEVDRLAVQFERQDIIRESLKNYSAIILVDNEEEAICVTNEYAPEHLEILTDYPMDIFDRIQNAGSVFLGHYTPVAVGDYLGISNHVLPSTGYARMFSPISVRTFQKIIQYESISPNALQRYTEKIMKPLAIAEGFGAHLASLEMRLSEMQLSEDDVKRS